MGNICGGGSVEYHRVMDRRLQQCGLKAKLGPEELRVINWENELDFQHIYFDQFEL